MKRSANIYFTACISGIFFNYVLLTFADAYVNFGYSGANTIYFHCEWGYIIKACLFSTIYFLLKDDHNFDNTTRRRAILRTPFLLFGLWFYAINHFDVATLKTDISAGSIVPFEHCFVQMLTMTVVTFFISLWVNQNYVEKTG
jgi:hypothetical protein